MTLLDKIEGLRAGELRRRWQAWRETMIRSVERDIQRSGSRKSLSRGNEPSVDGQPKNCKVASVSTT